MNAVRREKGYKKLDLSSLEGNLQLPYEIRNLRGTLEVEQWEFAKFDLMVDGSVDVKVPCDRCGEMFWQHVELENEEIFVIGREPVPTGEEKRLSEEDISTFYTPNGQVNVIELLSEYILSGLPTKLVCRDECPGPVELLGELGFVELILDEGGK